MRNTYKKNLNKFSKFIRDKDKDADKKVKVDVEVPADIKKDEVKNGNV
jgi:hypothetical protein